MTTRRTFVSGLCAAASLQPVTSRPRLIAVPETWRAKAQRIPSSIWKPIPAEPRKLEPVRPNGNGGGAGYTLMELTAAWLATGNEFYVDQARKMMHRVCEYTHWGGVNGKAKDTDLHAAAVLMGGGVTYDVLRDAIPASERQFVIDKFALQGRRMYEHHAKREHYPWEQNHTYIDLGALWCASVAFDMDAQWKELGARAITYAMRALDGEDGAFYEGLGYWNFGYALHLLPLLDMYRRATGEDLFAKSASLRHHKHYLLHTLMPGGEYWLNLGDTSGSVKARSSLSRARYAMFKMASEYNDPEAQFLAGYFTRVGKLKPSSEPWTLAFWNPEVPERDPRESWPANHHFRDLGLVTLRSSWRDDATYFAMRCGPALGHKTTQMLLRRELPKWKPSTGHVHPDLNAALMFDHGEHFVVDTGYTWKKVTAEHSTVAVDGGGQIGEGERWPSYDPWDRFGNIGAFLQLDREYAYVRGDAARGYQAALDLDRFDRHVTMMSDADETYFLIEDVLESGKPHTYDWILNAIDKAAQVRPGVYRVVAGKRAMTVHLLEPSPANVSQDVVSVTVRPMEGAVPERGHRLRASVHGENADFRALLAFHAANAAGPQVSAVDDHIEVKTARWTDALQGRTSIRRVGGSVARWAAIDATALPQVGFKSSAPVNIAASEQRVAVSARVPARIALGDSAIDIAAGDQEFDRTLITNWWTEGGERVWMENGKLHVKADAPGKAVATVFQRTQHGADFKLTLDAHVISSSVEANNINLFFSVTDPSGRPLEQTKVSRASADYGLYHKLNGYIITFLNDTEGKSGKARIRIRRNPGFHLLAEAFTYHCKAGVTYRLLVEKNKGDIRFSVDGQELLRAHDPQPLAGGHLALRTFRTHLWWDKIRVDFGGAGL